MSSCDGYNVGVAFALADYFQAKEKKEGRRGLLRKQRLEGELK